VRHHREQENAPHRDNAGVALSVALLLRPNPICVSSRAIRRTRQGDPTMIVAVADRLEPVRDNESRTVPVPGAPVV
jgi:hypothetical protein